MVHAMNHSLAQSIVDMHGLDYFTYGLKTGGVRGQKIYR
jgi:hypothetical protein